MSSRLHVPIAFVLAAGLASPAVAQSPEAEVLATVQAMLRVLETKDATPVAAHVDSTTRFTLLRPGPNGTRVLVISGSRFLQAVTNPSQPPAKELIRNPEIRIDGDLATVWTEYQVLVNGAVSHCGYDAFHLARIGGIWKVVNVSDSFRNTGCGSPWPESP